MSGEGQRARPIRRAAAILKDAPVVDVGGGGPGRAGYSEEFLRQIARDYAALVKEGKRRPLVHLVASLDRSEAQARRLVARAYERFPELQPDAGA